MAIPAQPPDGHIPSAVVTNTRKRFGSLRQVLVTVVARLRFVAILAAIGLAIVKWDLLKAHYERWMRPAVGTSAADPNTEYFCPMHPAIVRDNNKEKCPICFMPLSKRKKGELTDVALPAGTISRVQLSPYRVVLAGVRTTPVSFVPLTKEIVTVGTVEFDERGLKHVAARVKGRIEKLTVNQTGQMVHVRDELATLYSPDLMVTAQNLIDARRTRNTELERIARDRLKLWGLEPDQIDAIAVSGKAEPKVTVLSPIEGHVIRKYQTEGRYVDEGTPLFDVADLKTVWIQAQVYEEDLAFLPAKNHELSKTDRLPVAATTRAFPGETFAGALTFVYPHVDPESRTLTVRFELDNPDSRLKPGMTVSTRLTAPSEKLAKQPGARLRLEGGKVLAIPEASVIDTGAMTVVYRQDTLNVFDGRKVELGPRMVAPDGVAYFPVLAGLEPGDVVTTAGTFLIDAETRLNPAAGSIYIGGSSGGKTTSSVRPSTPEDADTKVATSLARLTPEDRTLAQVQGTCPVLDGSRLGSMGPPVKVSLDGNDVFLCCANCAKSAKADAPGIAAKAEDLRKGKQPSATAPGSKIEAKIQASLAKLEAADKPLAESQRFCPVTGQRLGSMGKPEKLMLEGRPVFVCCDSCNPEAFAQPAAMLEKAEAFKRGELPKK